VFPAESFDPVATMHAISDERCTALHGVPAMMESVINVEKPEGWTSELRTGIVAGSPVPRWLMERMVEDLGMTDFTSSYGLTEASPTVFNAHTTDSLHARLTSVGTVLPHARVKIVDHQDRVVPIGVRGELCVAGYQVCRGYWENAEKTAELLVRDDQGELWLHTGDEAVLDVDGYCTITGRFKDIIIRGTSSLTLRASLLTNLRRREHLPPRNRRTSRPTRLHRTRNRRRRVASSLRRSPCRVPTTRGRCRPNNAG
jgi:acyl-CoA synthetase (AMP-forming)/AMP-acid ligase II